MAIKSRIFNIMQYEKHPETEEVLLTEETIKTALAHRTIKRWAYIRHDEDVYSALDEEHNPDHIQGQTKPPHWHIVVEMGSNQVEIGVIAKWFKIAPNFVETAKGAGAFLDCCQYLTHEDLKQRELGKTLYSDDRIISNFKFREALSKRAEQKLKYGRELSLRDQIRYDVLYNGKKLSKVIEEYPLEYQEDMTALQRYRLEYLTKIAPAPSKRMNIYIEGPGGIGKGLISRALARAIIDRTGELYDDEIFFEVGSDKTTFEGYDGQPVIIWNDCRASTLLEKLGGRENVFNVFDLFPPNIKQNIKYGSIRLNNEINIVNSVETYSSFIKTLSGAEDRNQALRRIPLFLVLHEKDYDLGINKGVFEGTREYEQFISYKGIQANFREITNSCGDNIALRNETNRRSLAPVVEKFDETSKKLVHPQTLSDEEIREKFKDYGTIQGGEEIIELTPTGYAVDGLSLNGYKDD